MSENIINEQEIHQKELEDSKKETLANSEYKNLISNFAFQKVKNK